MKLFIYLFVVVSALAIAGVHSATTSPPLPTCKATYHSIGIYWKASTGSPTNACNVKYRLDGSSTYTHGFDLVWDDRTNKNVTTGYFNHGKEYRGSMVGLKTRTKYNIYLTVNQTGETVSFTCTTWAETLTISSTVYQGPAVIDVSKSTASNAVLITAPWVILDNVTIIGGASSAVYLSGNAHDVVIQNNDISGWGTIWCDGYGKNYDAGIRAQSSNWNITRVTIQRNVIRDPKSTANGWCDAITHEDDRCKAGHPTPANATSSSGCGFHPQGPQGIVLWNSTGNIVIRYNRISAGIQTNNYFNDGMGGGSNASPTGFPGADSDIYGNWMGHIMDDALEIEGGGMNVRVFNNFINETYTGVASAVASVGPLYIFRNVMYYSRRSPRGGLSFAEFSSGTFGKLGDFSGYGAGRRFYFHNTMLSGPAEGGRPGLADSGGPMTNTWSRNNLWWITTIYYSKSSPCVSADNFRTDGNNIDYDLCSNSPSSSYYTPHGIYNSIPVFKGGSWYCNNTNIHTISCMVALNTTSKGYDAGAVLPGFNSNYFGNAPDLGAQEYNAPNMLFGVHATV